MLYPLYTVPAEVLLEMKSVDSHEDLKAGDVSVQPSASLHLKQGWAPDRKEMMRKSAHKNLNHSPGREQFALL